MDNGLQIDHDCNVEEIDEFAKGFEITVGKAQKKKINLNE